MHLAGSIELVRFLCVHSRTHVVSVENNARRAVQHRPFVSSKYVMTLCVCTRRGFRGGTAGKRVCKILYIKSKFSLSFSFILTRGHRRPTTPEHTKKKGSLLYRKQAVMRERRRLKLRRHDPTTREACFHNILFYCGIYFINQQVPYTGREPNRVEVAVVENSHPSESDNCQPAADDCCAFVVVVAVALSMSKYDKDYIGKVYRFLWKSNPDGVAWDPVSAKFRNVTEL